MVGWALLASIAWAEDVSRAEILQRGAAHNLGLLAERARRTSALHGEHAADLPFAPTVGFRSELADEAVTHTVTGSWLSPIGTRLDASVPLGPDGDGLTLVLVQPLLQDGWLAGAYLAPRQARIDADIQRARFEGALNDLLAELDGAYWRLVVAQQDVAIKSRSRDRAQAQFDETRQNIARGILAEADIYVVEENLVIFEAALLRARAELDRAQRHLAVLSSGDTTPADDLVATDTLDLEGIDQQGADAAVAAALDGNPDLAAARLRTERARLDVAHAVQQALPTLDLQVDATHAEGLLGDATPTVSGSLTAEVPLAPRATLAGPRGARADRDQVDHELARQEQDTARRALDQLTLIEAGLARYDLAVRQLELAGLKLEAEQEKYLNGISRLSEVVRFQRDLDEASIGVQRQATDVRRVLAELAALQGALPTQAGIELR